MIRLQSKQTYLARVIAVGRIPAAIKDRFFAAVCAPLLLLGLGNDLLFLEVELFLEVGHALLLVGLHRLSHVHDDQVHVVFGLG